MRFLSITLCLAILGCGSFLSEVRDIELPWRVLAREGGMHLVEFVYRPYFATETLHLAGEFNDWTWPGHGEGRLYEMDWDKEREYWVARVWLKGGAWHYLYVADGKIPVADLKNTVLMPDGLEVSRLVLRE